MPALSPASSPAASQEDVRDLSKAVTNLAIQSAAIVERLDTVIEDNKELKQDQRELWSRVRSLEDWRKSTHAFERGREATKKTFFLVIKEGMTVGKVLVTAAAGAIGWLLAGGKLPLH